MLKINLLKMHKRLISDIRENSNCLLVIYWKPRSLATDQSQCNGCYYLSQFMLK